MTISRAAGQAASSHPVAVNSGGGVLEAHPMTTLDTTTRGIELMAHQSGIVRLMLDNPRYAFYHEPGCGKTIGTLALPPNI